MKEFICTELKEIFRFLNGNRNEIIITGFAALLFTFGKYFQIWNQWFSSFIYYFICPVIIILLLLRKNPLDFGLRMGSPKIWGPYVAATCLVSIPLLYVFTHSSQFQDYYTRQQFNAITYILTICVELFALEFILRGFLLFGLKEKYKEAAIVIQMIPFVLLHFGKPDIETLSTIITGLYFGFIAYRSNSCWPVVIIHIFINIFFVVSVNLL